MNTHKWSCKITQWWWRVLHYFMCASYCVCSSVQLITCTVSGTKLYVRRPSTSTCHVMTAAHVHARYVQPCIAWHVRMRLWPHQSDMHAHMHAWHDMHSTTHGNMHVNMLACTCACACCADLHVAWMNGQKWTNDYAHHNSNILMCTRFDVHNKIYIHLLIYFQVWLITYQGFVDQFSFDH